MKEVRQVRAMDTKPTRVVVAGDTCVSAQGLATIVGRDKRYQVCGGAHGFYDAGELIRKHQPDVLLIEPFLEDRDGIRWIEDLATEYPRTRILIVSRQSERIYGERVLQAGATGYWMKNGSEEELLRAVDMVAAGKVYVSPLITSLALEKFAHCESLPQGLDVLTDRELAVFALIAAETRCRSDCEGAWYQPNHGGNALSEHQIEAWLSQRRSAQARRARIIRHNSRVAELLMTL